MSTLTNNITYCGKFSFDFFSPAIFSNQLFDQVSVADGIKNTMTLPLVTVGNVTVGDSCSFSDLATITLDPRVLAPCTYMFQKEICINTIEPTFLSERLRSGANTVVGPDEFNTYLLGQISALIGQDMQNFFWGGTSGCTGIFTILGGAGQTSFASGVVGVTAAAGVTAGNVYAELAKVYLAIPAKVKDSGRAAIFVTGEIMDAYLVANAVSTNTAISPANLLNTNYAGLSMFRIKTSNTRRMVAADPKNLWIGTDMLDDMQSVRIVDMSDTTAEPKVRIVARWRFGVQIGVLSEVVYYA